MTLQAEDTYAAAVATIQRLAAHDFRAHVLSPVGPQEWHCHRPGTGISSFRVLVRPGTVVVWGDIGEGIFRGGEAGSTLAWLRDAVDSESYLLGKLRTETPQFYAGDALTCAREGAAEGATLWLKVLPEAERLHRHGELYPYAWSELVYTLGGDGDQCGVGWDYSARALWLVEALKWLAAHLPPMEDENA